MFSVKQASLVKSEYYSQLHESAKALLTSDMEPISILSNAAALLAYFLPDINWAGFYLTKGDMLYLGPFQGLPACVEIPLGQGVCGTAAATQKTLRIQDVHAFEGHIACDAASNSEIVIPLVKDGKLIGVCDIDSPLHSRFTEEDEIALKGFVDCIVSAY